MATAALLITGAISTGRLAAIAGKARRFKLSKNSGDSNQSTDANSRRDHHGEH
jgi:hypothetical protein